MPEPSPSPHPRVRHGLLALQTRSPPRNSLLHRARRRRPHRRGAARRARLPRCAIPDFSTLCVALAFWSGDGDRADRPYRQHRGERTLPRRASPAYIRRLPRWHARLYPFLGKPHERCAPDAPRTRSRPRHLHVSDELYLGSGALEQFRNAMIGISARELPPSPTSSTSRATPPCATWRRHGSALHLRRRAPSTHALHTRRPAAGDPHRPAAHRRRESSERVTAATVDILLPSAAARHVITMWHYPPRLNSRRDASGAGATMRCRWRSLRRDGT